MPTITPIKKKYTSPIPTITPIKMKYTYLWIVETLLDGSVEESLYLEDLTDVDALLFRGEGTLCNGGTIRYRIGIGCDAFEESIFSGWAYVQDGIIPTHFTDRCNGVIAKVPARYKRELEVLKKRLHLYWIGKSVKVGA